MIGFIRDWILNIVTLVLFIVLVEMLVPTGKMKKYVSLITGIVLVIAIISPFLEIFGSKFELTDLQTANSNFLDRKEIEKDGKILEEEQMKQITDVYRKKLISQIEDGAKSVEGITGAKADIIINEDYNSGDFGEIKRVYLEVSQDGKGSSIKPVAEIEKVKVGDDESVPHEAAKPDPALVKKLEEKLAGLFNLNRDNIVISLQGG